MWRNGRRNGLKIRSREKRGMGSTPIIGTSKDVVLLGKNVTIRDFVGCERSRTKTHKNTIVSDRRSVFPFREAVFCPASKE